MSQSNIDVFKMVKFCEGFGVQQRVEEFCVMAGILLASKPRNVLEIGVYGGGSLALLKSRYDQQRGSALKRRNTCSCA